MSEHVLNITNNLIRLKYFEIGALKHLKMSEEIYIIFCDNLGNNIFQVLNNSLHIVYHIYIAIYKHAII